MAEAGPYARGMERIRPDAARAAPWLALCAALTLSACATSGGIPPVAATDIRVTEHRASDDLLTAGLGIDGLRAMVPPAFADPERPTAVEARRRAIWASWRGIADLGPLGGYGTLYGSLASVPGREYGALATLPGARQPHRVLAQVPDAFDAGKRCLVVTVASGSRGVYGAQAVGAAWGLPRGCAVVHTDKGAGSDYFDLDAGAGIGPDGRVAAAGERSAFTPADPAGRGIAFKHAHSQDNPEADWGRHARQAAEFGLQALSMAHPEAAPFTFGNTRVIAVGISNGGGAVLRAAELEGDWLDGVVAGEPNVWVEGNGGRPLYDYATEAALLMPCALPALGLPALPQAEASCTALAAMGRIEGADTAARQASALAMLRANGWSEASLRAGAISATFDLWRSVAVTYASAYARAPHDAHPCGYGFAALGTDGRARAATAAERAAWWSDASGIPPGSGVHIVDPDPASPLGGLRCLRALWEGDSEASRRVREGIAQTRAGLPCAGLPVIVVHGEDDGLVPMAFSSRPYVAAARAAGRGDVRYWQVPNAQHFDAFLALPQYGARYLPLLPYVYAALDGLEAYLDGRASLPGDRRFETVPRAADQPLDAGRHLALPTE